MSSAISRLLPSPRLHQIDRVAVATDAASTWAAARAFDFYSLGFVRALFATRTVPDHLSALIHGRHVAPAPRTMHVDDIYAQPSGFRRLDERPGEEIVLGAIGKVWEPSIPFVDVPDGDAFLAFDQPGFAKVAWAIQVHPRVSGGAWLGVDVRVGVTDESAWRRFVPYWALIGRFSHLIRRAVLRSLAQKLGRPAKDEERALPGDEFLLRADASWTHAVTIEAPPEHVWPWLAQMGCRRGGWYSLDLLDNGGYPSADRIIPELQRIRVGDLLPATRKDEGGFAVLRVAPPGLLVLGSPSLLPGAHDRAWGMLGARYDTTWAFVLEPIGDDATRLVVRVRGAMDPGLRSEIAKALLQPTHAIMERAQLKNLKHLAEQANR
jgi:hypothetical protein